MAELFGAQVPSPDALSQWFVVLRDQSPFCVKAAGRHIVRTHKYRNLPLPADFLAAIEASPEWQEVQNERTQLRLMANAHERAQREKERETR